MTNSAQKRSYPEGSIIFVDPEVKAAPGDSVIAMVPETLDITFKILSEDAGRMYLRPLNPQYPIIEITGRKEIFGKVIGTFIIE